MFLVFINGIFLNVNLLDIIWK